MKFCPKCGSILMPKKASGKYTYSCSCGYTAPVDEDAALKESVKNDDDIEVIDEENDVEANPVVDVVCPKCGHTKAHFWLEQTRSGDESETKFFKCEKCKHRWRDYE